MIRRVEGRDTHFVAVLPESEARALKPAAVVLNPEAAALEPEIRIDEPEGSRGSRFMVLLREVEGEKGGHSRRGRQ